MYPIKHPFIYEGEVKLTAKLFHRQRCGPRLGENVDNAFSRHHNDDVRENIATGRDWNEYLAALFSVISFHCLNELHEELKARGKWNEKIMFRKLPENVRRWILLVETAFVAVRMKNIAQRNSKNW